MGKGGGKELVKAEGGNSAMESLLKEARFLSLSAKDLKEVGFTPKELKNSFSAAELRVAGFSAKELKVSGFSAKDLKEPGNGHGNGHEIARSKLVVSKSRSSSLPRL